MSAPSSQLWLQVRNTGESLKHTSAPVLVPSGTDLIGMVGSRHIYYLKARGFSNVCLKLRTSRQDDL